MAFRHIPGPLAAVWAWSALFGAAPAQSLALHTVSPLATAPLLQAQPQPQEQPPAGDAPATPPNRLTEQQTQIRVGQYERAEHWALRGLVLLSLGRDWHPCAAPIVLDGLKSKDDHLQIYAIESLVRTSPIALRRVLNAEILENLIRVQFRKKDDFLRTRLTLVLRAAFPAHEATTAREWERHWFDIDKVFQRDPWPSFEIEADGRSVAGAAFDRALDLYEAGLEVAICIDSTGSMQQTIDAASRAIDDLVAVLSGIAPDFRIGLVHYKDLDDIKDGAQVLVPLDTRPKRIREKLERLRAEGGGDVPERVECGLELALDPKRMKWRRDANKLVVLVGDAPPHASALAKCVELAREAYERPYGKVAKRVRATVRRGGSAAKTTRPFVTAAIGVGMQSVPGRTRTTFKEIAEAGGGAYGEVTTAPTRKLGPKESASDEIVAHVLRLSFGAQYEDQIGVFVEVFFDYQRRGFFD